MTEPKKIKRKLSAEVIVYGKEAVFALWKKRPNDVVRVYCTEERLPLVGPLLKWCAEQKKAYHVVSKDDMDKITHATHHGGIAVLSKKRPTMDFRDFVALEEQHAPLVFLDGVVNPHNVGAVVRTMAHFGCRFLLGDKESMPDFSPSWMRVSEGGSEWVDVVLCENKVNNLLKLKNMGYSIVCLSQKSAKTIYDQKLPKKSVFVFGSELEGISKEITAIATDMIKIPGTSRVESLNVSTSFGICLSEWYRFHV